MENGYEILRFIEHGAHCRQSLDWMEGTLLAYYLREHPQLDKELLFGWFRQLGNALDQYQRCRKGQNYRYLNPYSILVTEEGQLFLLNLEAPENGFVMKKMQQKAVRNHFVRPMFTRTAQEMRLADLFGLGRTMQFILACTQTEPPLTRREERKMERIIEKCAGERKKKYEEIRQVLKDLPAVSDRREQFRIPRTWMLGGGAVVAAAVFAGYAVSALFIGEAESMSPAAAQREDVTEVTVADEQEADENDGGTPAAGTSKIVAAETEQTEESAREDCLEEAGEILRSYLLENTTEGNQSALLFGKELELEAVRCLAAAYEREEMTEEAICAYGRLLEIEDRSEMIESAGIRKMKLEAAQGQYAKALLTGETVQEKTGGSEEAERLMEEYRTAGETEADAVEKTEE